MVAAKAPIKITEKCHIPMLTGTEAYYLRPIGNKHEIVTKHKLGGDELSLTWIVESDEFIPVDVDNEHATIFLRQHDEVKTPWR